MAELVRAATASALSAGLISRTGKIWINVRIVESRSATKKEPPAIFGRRLYRTTRGGATTKTNEEIVAAFQAGDQSALSELWANNERGVKYLADKIAAAGLGDAEDLLQEGFFGLLKAAEDYDPAEGVAFMTYAWQWLRNAMFGSIRATGSAIRLPSHIQEKIWRYRRFISEYQKSTGSSPSDAQICAVLSVDAAALAKIRELGVKNGIVVKPKTPAEALIPYLDKVDMVLVMTVEPGFGGQKFMADQMPKVKKLRELLDQVNPACHLEVDGGVDLNTCITCKENGADVLVAGSAFFGSADWASFTEQIEK